MNYDLIILGAGPAGITAAVYAARKRMKFMVITENVGGQTILTSSIENYTGYMFITGQELIEKFREHLEHFDVELKEDEKALEISKDGDLIEVKTDKGSYKASTLLIATGRIPRKLEVPGEQKYLGKGVAYCATCDAPLFAGKEVAVVGGGNSALDAVLQLMKVADKIYLIDTADDLKADPIMVEKAKADSKVQIYTRASVKEIKGEDFVKAVSIESEGKVEELSAQGVFIEAGSVPSADFAANLQKNSGGEIKVNCQTETSMKGVFAAGDVTDVYAKQIVVACGEGAKAALASYDYLNKNVK